MNTPLPDPWKDLPIRAAACLGDGLARRARAEADRRADASRLLALRAAVGLAALLVTLTIAGLPSRRTETPASLFSSSPTPSPAPSPGPPRPAESARSELLSSLL